MFNHVAVVTRDLTATHRFYTEAMGFRLAKVEVGPTENEGGWAKHVFYDTGDGLMAFWELHDDKLPDTDPALSTGIGLPAWVNHLAFDAADDAAYRVALDRWLDNGIDVVELDHGWCRSIYCTDPGGTLVEWCLMTRPLDDDDAAEAARLLTDPAPGVKVTPVPIFHAARAAASAP